MTGSFLSDLISKRILCVVCTSIWGEGTDVPPLRWVLYAKAGSANTREGGIELEQLIGRLCRRAPGKYRAGFIDFQDGFDSKYAAKSRARARFLRKKGFTTSDLDEAPSKNGRPRFLAE